MLDDSVPAALSPKGLTHKKSTFTRFDALRDLAERATDGATIDEVERVTTRLLDDPEAVDLGVDSHGSEDIELRSGRRIGTVTRRYSTRELLALEQRIIDLATRKGTTPRPHLMDSVTKLVLATKAGPSGPRCLFQAFAFVVDGAPVGVEQQQGQNTAVKVECWADREPVGGWLEHRVSRAAVLAADACHPPDDATRPDRCRPEPCRGARLRSVGVMGQ